MTDAERIAYLEARLEAVECAFLNLLARVQKVERGEMNKRHLFLRSRLGPLDEPSPIFYLSTDRSLYVPKRDAV
jgi:hypothetical protein